jgi:hypothetical protein
MFERYRVAFAAPQDAPGGGGTPPNAGVGAGTVDVNELVNQVVGKRVKKEFSRMMESLPTLIQGAIKEAIGQKPADGANGQQPAPANSGEGQDRLSLKGLHEQIANLQKGIESERQARQKAEDGNRLLRIRSEVESHVLRHLGADSPNAPLVLSHFLPSFSEENGAVGRKTRDEYGTEQFVGVKDAVDEMFKQELKHLLPARNGTLPPARVQPTVGSTFRPPGPASPVQMNPLAAEFIEGLAASGRPEMANAVMASLQNGTAPK